MVGVAGKSRACHDCKRRRVKCDFRRPSCSRCKKAGLACQGYDKALIFVNRTFSQPSRTAPGVISEELLHREQNIPKLSPSLEKIFQRLMISMPDLSSSPVDFRSQAWELLKDLYLPRAQQTDLSITTPDSWLHAVCQTSLESNALDRSLLAFCAVQIHIAEPWSISMDLALQLYSEALPELVRSLGNSQQQCRIETLAAIVVLSTCELFILPNDQSWQAHAQGISELLSYNISYDDQVIVWLRLCSRLRVICVIIALTKHRQLALNLNTWRQFLSPDGDLESFETLVDLVSEVPPLLEESDEVIATGTANPKLLQSFLHVFRRINAWQQTYTLRSTKPLFWAVPSRLHNPSDDDFENRLFPFALEFDHLNVAIHYIFSLGVMLQILTTALLLLEGSNGFYKEVLNEGSIPPSNPDHAFRCETTSPEYCDDGQSLLSVLSINREADRIARFLCQSLEYCFRRDMGTLGAQATCHQQWAVQRYFRQSRLERELEWCRNVKKMKGSGFRCGIDLMSM